MPLTMLTSHHISSYPPMAIPKAMCLALSCPSDNRKILPVEILMEQQQGILPPLLLCTCSDGRHHIHGNLRRRGCRSSHPRQWFCNATETTELKRTQKRTGGTSILPWRSTCVDRRLVRCPRVKRTWDLRLV